MAQRSSEAGIPDQDGISPFQVLDALHSCDISHVITVPDYVQMSLHALLEQQERIVNVSCAAEDQAVAVAAGMYIGGLRPLVMIQNQGLFAGLNALRALGLDAGLPILMMIGEYGREFANRGKATRDSSRRLVRTLEPILEVLEDSQLSTGYPKRHWKCRGGLPGCF